MERDRFGQRRMATLLTAPELVAQPEKWSDYPENVGLFWGRFRASGFTVFCPDLEIRRISQVHQPLPQHSMEPQIVWLRFTVHSL